MGLDLRDKNVFVTGAGGFVGQNLALRLVEEGARPICLLHVQGHRTVSEAVEIASRHGAVFYGDITDSSLLAGIMARYEVDYVIHLAAISIVGQCDNNPALAYEVNVGGAISLMEAMRSLKRKPNKIIHMSCYDEETRGLTLNGLKRYDEIEPGDKVLSINPKTREIEETEVLEVIVQDYEGEMVHFRGKSIDLLVTPNHRMFVEDGEELTFVRADSKIPARGFPRAYGSWIGKGVQLPPQPEHHWNIRKIVPEPKIEDLLYLLGIYIGDGCIEQQVRITPSKSGLSAKERALKARDSKTNQYVSTPNAAEERVVKSTSNVIYLYIPYADPCRPRLEACLDRLGVKFYNWDHGGEGALYFSSAELCHWFKDAGHLAPNKRIPRWALDGTKEQLVYLLSGLIDSDGNESTSRTFTTTSFGLVQDILELAMKCNVDTSFHQKKSPKHPVFIEGRQLKNIRPSYVVSFSSQKKSIWSAQRSIVENYQGKIWCLRLKENKNFMVEKNGFTIFCGNTDKSFGVACPDGGYKETTPLEASDAYCTSKACGDMIARSYAKTYGLPVCVIRAGNLYGPRDLNMSRLIPKSIVKLLRGESPTLYSGAAKFIREFIFVDDILDAYLTILEKGEPGEPYNVGGTPPRQILDVINMISTKITGGVEAVNIEEVDFPEIPFQYLDATKLQSLGWKAKTNLEEGLEKTIEWFKLRI